MTLEERVAAEIEALHLAFEQWFRGEADAIDRIEASLAEDFTFVSPQGDLIPIETMRSNLRAARGHRDVLTRIRNAQVCWDDDNTVVAIYEEWHQHPDYETTRQSTVLLTKDERAPGGFLWRHVHETWKLPPPHRR